MNENTAGYVLADKVAIITGAGSGLGASIARRFADAGAKVVLGDLKLEAAEKIGGSIIAGGGNAVSVLADVSVSEGFEALVGAAIGNYRKLDIVVNCAGFTQPLRRVEEIDEDTFDRLFKVNVKSLFWSVRHTLPHLQNGSVMINIASIGAIRPRSQLCWYNASKGAVETATRALAIELADRGIRVCAINPSLADTPMTREMLAGRLGQVIDDLVRTIPLGRLCKPEDVAEAALFLASDNARYLTGTCLDVDGGRSI